MSLVKDLDAFAHTWLSNPAALLAFAKLIERAALLDVPKHAELAELRGWVAEEKRSAAAIGIR